MIFANIRIEAIRVSFLTFREEVLKIQKDFSKNLYVYTMRTFNKVVVSQTAKFSMILNDLMKQ